MESAKPLKIAMILRRLNVPGGTQGQALMLATELKNKGNHIDIYTLDLDREKCYGDLLANFNIITPADKDRKRADTVSAPFSFIPPVAQFVRESRQAKLLARLMAADYDLLNPHDQVSYRTAYYYKRLVKNIPSVWNMNDLPIKMWGYDRMRGCRDNFHQPWYRVLAYKIFDRYDNIKFISRQDAIVVVDFFNRDLVRDYLGLKAFTVRSGPDFEHFPYREHSAPNRNSVKILTSGILMPHRRYEDAIEGIKILRDKGYGVTLTIMGDYENDLKYYNNLRKLTEELGLTPYVNFTGRVSEDELIASYHNHHIYTFQHHLQSDGLSPCEAASCGMALVVSDTAGCHEYFTHGETAMIIEAKNPQDWADKVRMLIDDKALYERIAREANKFVRANFSWQKYASGVLDVFSGVHIDVPD